jgi:hypothetical protein
MGKDGASSADAWAKAIISEHETSMYCDLGAHSEQD